MAESDASESSQSGVPTPFELRGQKQIDEVKQYKKNVKALVDFGIPEACFEDHNCLMEGVLPTHRAKLVKVFQPFIDKDQLEEVYTIGLINKVVGAKSKLKTAQFFKFCNWLKSPDGAKAIREHQLREKLQEKGKGDFTAYQVGNLAIYDTMRAELAAKEKRIRSKKEAQILALQEQIAALRDEEDAELAKAREEFDPVPKITFPDTMEFNKACWDEYARELAAKGKPVPRLTVALLTEAVNLYQDVIRQRVVLEHLEHADGIKKLHGWVERKVAHFQRKRKLKQATRFRRLLASVGLSYDDGAPTEEEDENAGSDTSRHSAAQSEDQILRTFIASPLGREPEEEEAEGDAEHTPHPKKRRNKRARTGAAGDKSKAKRTPRTRRERKAGNPVQP
ncbi:TPA_asm: hypothetical protein [Amaranthus tuberculatus amalgavirus 2]|nr:TPA_asm: hypothetical protein [Amaranthus tuberculatus amalgavirus 2]